MKFRFEVKRGQAAAVGQHGQSAGRDALTDLSPPLMPLPSLDVVPSQSDPQLLGHSLAPHTFPLLLLPGPSAHHPRAAPSPRCSPSPWHCPGLVLAAEPGAGGAGRGPGAACVGPCAQGCWQGTQRGTAL